MNSARSAHLDLRSPKPTHSFREPADITTATGNDTFLMELVATVAFQRLKEIRFLGAIDYCLGSFAKRKAGSDPLHALRAQSRRHAIGTAVLRDPGYKFGEPAVGMCCGSATRHRTPPAFTFNGARLQGRTGIEHHKATKDIIAGRVPIGKDVHSYFVAMASPLTT